MSNLERLKGVKSVPRLRREGIVWRKQSRNAFAAILVFAVVVVAGLGVMTVELYMRAAWSGALTATVLTLCAVALVVHVWRDITDIHRDIRFLEKP